MDYIEVQYPIIPTLTRFVALPVIPGGGGPLEKCTIRGGSRGGPEKPSQAGAEMIAATMQRIYAAGGLVSTEDAVNGFNALSRQAMHDRVRVVWPERGDGL